MPASYEGPGTRGVFRILTREPISHSRKFQAQVSQPVTRIFFQRIPTAATSAEGGWGGHPQVGLQHLKPQLCSNLSGWMKVRGATTHAPCPTVRAQTGSPTPLTSVPAGATASFQFLLHPLSPPPPLLLWYVFCLSLQVTFLLPGDLLAASPRRRCPRLFLHTLLSARVWKLATQRGGHTTPHIIQIFALS